MKQKLSDKRITEYVVYCIVCVFSWGTACILRIIITRAMIEAKKQIV